MLSPPSEPRGPETGRGYWSCTSAVGVETRRCCVLEITAEPSNSLKTPVPLDRLQLAVRLARSVRFGAYQTSRNASRRLSLTVFAKTSLHRAERAERARSFEPVIATLAQTPAPFDPTPWRGWATVGRVRPLCALRPSTRRSARPDCRSHRSVCVYRTLEGRVDVSVVLVVDDLQGSFVRWSMASSNGVAVDPFGIDATGLRERDLFSDDGSLNGRINAQVMTIARVSPPWTFLTTPRRWRSIST